MNTSHAKLLMALLGTMKHTTMELVNYAPKMLLVMVTKLLSVQWVNKLLLRNCNAINVRVTFCVLETSIRLIVWTLLWTSWNARMAKLKVVKMVIFSIRNKYVKTRVVVAMTTICRWKIEAVWIVQPSIYFAMELLTFLTVRIL